MTLADYSALTFVKRMSIARWRAISLHKIASLRHSQSLVAAGLFEQAKPRCEARHDSRERHRDEMIRQGLMS